MNEAHVEESLLRYLDNALPDDEKRRVDAHLCACRACREELAYLRRIQGLLKLRDEASPGLWDGVAAGIRREGPLEIWAHFEWTGRRLVPLLTAAAALMIAVLGSAYGGYLAITLEDYLKAQWDPDGPEGIVLSDTGLSPDDILRLMDSAIPPTPQTR